LLDWALWLKFAKFGFIGRPCINASFIAISSENDISAGSIEDYQIKHERVSEDFVKPLIEMYSQEKQQFQQPIENDNGILKVI